MSGRPSGALGELLQPPSTSQAQQLAIHALEIKVGAHPVGSKLDSHLNQLIQQAQASQVGPDQLAQSTTQIHTLLDKTRAKLAAVQSTTLTLQSEHDKLEDGLIDHHELLVSSLSQREHQAEDQGTLRERLDKLSTRRKELQLAREWFQILAQTEELGINTLRAADQSQLEHSFKNYVELVQHINRIHDSAPTLALTAHLVAMASSVWAAVVKVLSTRLLAKVEKIGWPAPLKEPLDWTVAANIEFKIAFLDLLALEQLRDSNPLPGQDEVELAVRPVLAIVPLVHPLLLRFRWHFDGDRNTNRIDKPEYPLSHVLNLLTSHERFLSEDVQPLLDSYGFTDVDAVNEFTSQLLPPLESRLRHQIPQLLEMPPVLAHTVYQTLDFDAMLKSRDYAPRGAVSLDEWHGLSEIILGNKAWFNSWLEGEREFFESRYYAAISEADAWQILTTDEYESPDGRNSTRPSQSALRVAELVQQLAERYRPLPKPHTLPFLLTLHLPLLSSYSARISSALDAFESLAMSILPGALTQTSGAATAGLGGLLRLVRAGVSARWMAEKSGEWGEDAFFLSLYEFLTTTEVPVELEQAAREVLNDSDGTLFDGERKQSEHLADRAEELIVRHIVRETLAEMKQYLAKRWDFPPPGADEPEGATDLDGNPELSLSPALISSLSLFSSMLSTLTSSFPPTAATALYRRTATALSTTLYDRLLVHRAWSEAGAQQLAFDLEHGFLQAAREAKVPRGVGRGWELLRGAATVLALPAGEAAEAAEGGVSFARVMRMAWDDVAPEGEGSEWGRVLEGLGVGEVVGKAQARQVMRKRPECWR